MANASEEGSGARLPAVSHRVRRVRRVGLVAVALVVVAVRLLTLGGPGAGASPSLGATSPPAAGPTTSHADFAESASAPLTPEEQEAAHRELTAGKAVILGLVEGITEYLPVSSTGHLLVAERILDVGQTDSTKEAANTYTIAIQIGAIFAVAVLYFGRLRRMAEGALGRDPTGRRTLIAVLIAFVPAAIVGLVGSKAIEDQLLKVGPVVVTWIIGAFVIFAFAHRFAANRGGVSLDAITIRQALIIGAAQTIALIPGTSRSMVTILAALLVGLSLSAAVEFSFLLGLVTITAATGYGLLRHGGDLVDAYGWINPLIGLVVAFVSAMAAVRWMVTYLERHSLSIFGWYRLGVAAITIALLATSVI